MPSAFNVNIRGASPLGLPCIRLRAKRFGETLPELEERRRALSRAPLRRRAPFAWLPPPREALRRDLAEALATAGTRCARSRRPFFLGSRRAVLSILVAAAVSLALGDASALFASATRRMTLAEARPVLAVLGEYVPAELRRPALSERPGTRVEGPPEDLERYWATWVDRRDAAIRARVAKGDEDSVVNLLLYGTTFTDRTRATPDAFAPSGKQKQLAAIMDGRLEDLVRAVESPGSNERVAFVRQVIERHGIAVGPRSRESVRNHLVALRSRVLADNERYAQRAGAVSVANDSQRRAAYATLYRDRGLSTDSSLRVNFAVEQALAAVRERRTLNGRVERAAVVGPGLDFIDKAQGYDFYPVQMIQPFALADSLLRTGLAERPAIAALDISARVLDHLRHARQRARLGTPYRLNLVLERDRPGLAVDPDFAAYWRRAGDRLGIVAPIASPPGLKDKDVQVRTVAVRADAVQAVDGLEMNIVIERILQRFDLVVATNVLVYYEPFEQALAVSNMAAMLREGGLLLTNQPVPLPSAWGLSPAFVMSVSLDRVQSASGSHERGDAIYVYQKG